MQRRIGVALALIVLAAPLGAQTDPREGIEDRPIGVHALTGVTVIVAPGETIEDATIIIRDGVIADVGTRVRIPADARVWDLGGKTVTAGWIDLDLRVPAILPDGEASREGRHWNTNIHPEISIAEGIRLAESTAKGHRETGFAIALASPDGGILAGVAALVRLTGRDDRRTTIEGSVASIASIESGGFRGGGYPGSRMGAIALLRQTFLDTQWYTEAWRQHTTSPAAIQRPEVNRALAAVEPVLAKELPLALRSQDALGLLSIGEVAKEFGVGAWAYGSGEEYLWLDPVRALRLPLVIPVTYPETPTVDGPGGDTNVTLRELELWARAPENAIRLDRAGVRFSMTPRGLESVSDFPARVRTSIERGLSAETALAAVTTEAAAILGIGDRYGTVRRGSAGTLSVFDGAPFGKETHVVEVWIDGERFPVDPLAEQDLRGMWELTLDRAAGPAEVTLSIAGDESSPRLTAKLGETSISPATLHRQGNEVGLTLGAAAIGEGGFLRLGGVYGGGETFEGTARAPDGSSIRFTAKRTGPVSEEDTAAAKSEDKDAKAAEGNDPEGNDPEADRPREGRGDRGRGGFGRGGGRGRGGFGRGGGGSLSDEDRLAMWSGSADEKLPVPLGARGRTTPPAGDGNFLIRGATIWTSGPDGIIEDGSLLVRGGKIAAVGKNVTAPAQIPVIEAAGRHVTPGIIDPHSHTAIIGGVNEGTQAVTAEVRIGDVVQADDINIYRQLAGGVTSAHLMHGSANPIGGQGQVVQYKWGEPPALLKVEGPKLIKCALGENVKQSNWDAPTGRYPQTRMGVEQVFRDGFWAAREYMAEWDRYQQRNGVPVPRPRVDLELEALAEILRGERLIHCHSYRQDEILMLIRVAEDFGFTVGTFQHVLEGYKIAEEIARHGAAASSFSDWWAYKFEVYDAIPYNGAILYQAGVLTSYNSDSDELARRLNLEAAKAVKYGDVPRDEALKFVTLNPAKQLTIDGWTGSLEVGKAADLVIWSGDPLSTASAADETWIGGRRYYSRSEDAELRARDIARREVLISRVLAEKHGNPKRAEASEEKGAGR